MILRRVAILRRCAGCTAGLCRYQRSHRQNRHGGRDGNNALAHRLLHWIGQIALRVSSPGSYSAFNNQYEPRSLASQGGAGPPQSRRQTPWIDHEQEIYCQRQRRRRRRVLVDADAEGSGIGIAACSPWQSLSRLRCGKARQPLRRRSGASHRSLQLERQRTSTSPEGQGRSQIGEADHRR